MTLAEYRIRCTAYKLKRLDDEYMTAKLAWLNREITARKRKGKNKSEYVYKTFKKFFDYEAEEKRILKSENNEMSDVGKRYLDFMRDKHADD